MIITGSRNDEWIGRKNGSPTTEFTMPFDDVAIVRNRAITVQTLKKKVRRPDVRGHAWLACGGRSNTRTDTCALMERVPDVNTDPGCTRRGGHHTCFSHWDDIGRIARESLRFRNARRLRKRFRHKEGWKARRNQKRLYPSVCSPAASTVAGYPRSRCRAAGDD